MSDDPLTECPVCEGSLRRVVNRVGIVFKGSGFYVTDNRNGRSKKGAGAGGRTSTSKEQGQSSASDSPTGGGDAGGESSSVSSSQGTS